MRRRKILAVCLALAAGLVPAQDGTLLESPGIDALNATEEFRVGLDAYNRFYYNEAILAFEKALSYRPGEGIILDYLGRAYYSSGLEDIALREWQAAAAAYGPMAPETLLINNRMEVTGARRALFSEIGGARFVETGRYPGSAGGYLLFSQPSSVLWAENGSAWVCAYGSNEIVRVDVNGMVRERRRGPAAGFDRPYGIARGLDGRLYVSEFRGGRVSVLSPDGAWLSYIGSKGLEEGKLLGPSGVAIDEEGYLYVVDYGNRRVSKFDPDGAFILTFGQKTALFNGFASPTGIAASRGAVYVADGIANTVSMFDTNGLFLGVLVDEGLLGPESLAVNADGSLLVADTRRVVAVDTNTAITRELTATGNSRVRLTGASGGVNSSILAADFDADEVTVFSSLETVAGGLFVRIEQIITSQFPTITLELSVRDRSRAPIVGLNANNFLLTEGGADAANTAFLGADAPAAAVAVMFERSPRTRELKPGLRAAVRDIQAALDEGGAALCSIVSAGPEPVRERFNAANADSLFQAAQNGTYSAAWRFDIALRLAASDVLPHSRRRAVVFAGAGPLGEKAFEQYDLSQLAAYLANNGVAFYAVRLDEAAPAPELEYLCRETGGAFLDLYRRQGAGAELKKIGQKPAGAYTLSYESRLPRGAGPTFQPVEAEVYLLERSGRDASGYFPPLE